MKKMINPKMKTEIRSEKFHVTPNRKGLVDLDAIPTQVDPFYPKKAGYRKMMDSFTPELGELQRVLYAHGRYALLLIFQGMDTSGKDGAIRHVMSGVNPQGCQVHSFKQPSAEELAHDYLWRTTKRLPMRGHIGIFNRSYYEEVLVVKVVPEILKNQSLPESCLGRKSFWRDRYRDIVRFEQYLERNGTKVLKFFLHLSKEEQRKRLLARAKEPEKHWKVSPADLKSRALWEDYQRAYGECLANTSHAAAPWHVVPADDKRNARLIISQILIQTLQSLPIQYPKPGQSQIAAVEEIRKTLEKEKTSA